ncbi:MAG: hypothetical protein JRD49_05290 [Deltaproteobacteria bacterium]|nr:hypothetical protein [Deltaproteobacteria bacterium]
MMIDRILAIVDAEIESAHACFLTESEALREEDDFQLDAAREQLWISRDIIPRHFINSLFTSIFALFEDEMVSVGELAGKKAEEATPFIKFKNGIGLSKVRLYMKRELQISVESISSWQEITYIKDLRNMILHNNGRFEDRNPDAAQRLSRYIETCEGLTLDEFGHIVIDRQYLNHVTEVFRSFLKELFPKLEARRIAI